MRVVRGLAAILSGSLLGLAACSDGGDDPVVLPTGTTQPSATPTPTESTTVPSSTSEPTPTTTLVLPDEHVPEVDVFVQEFFAAYNAAQDSRDFAAFDSMYLPQCEGCVQMRGELENWLADGGDIEGADWVVQQQFSELLVDDYDASVIAFRQGGARLDGSGAETAQIGQLEPQVFNLIVPQSPPLAVASLAYGPA